MHHTLISVCDYDSGKDLLEGQSPAIDEVWGQLPSSSYSEWSARPRKANCGMLGWLCGIWTDGAGTTIDEGLRRISLTLQGGADDIWAASAGIDSGDSVRFRLTGWGI